MIPFLEPTDVVAWGITLRAIGFREAINELDSKGDAEDEAA
jgi:hypothetical protein